MSTYWPQSQNLSFEERMRQQQQPPVYFPLQNLGVGSNNPAWPQSITPSAQPPAYSPPQPSNPSWPQSSSNDYTQYYQGWDPAARDADFRNAYGGDINRLMNARGASSGSPAPSPALPTYNDTVAQPSFTDSLKQMLPDLRPTPVVTPVLNALSGIRAGLGMEATGFNQSITGKDTSNYGKVFASDKNSFISPEYQQSFNSSWPQSFSSQSPDFSSNSSNNSSKIDNPYTGTKNADPSPYLKDAQDKVNELYMLFDDTGSNYDQLANEYNSGQGSYEEYLKKIEEDRVNSLRNQSGIARANLEAQRPIYERTYNESVGDIGDQLGNVRRAGKTKREDVGTSYEEGLSRTAKTKKELDRQRKNLFSYLGTADSSAFINQQTQADTEFGGQIGDLSSEKAKQMGIIDDEITRSEEQGAKLLESLGSQYQELTAELNRALSANDVNTADDIQAQRDELLGIGVKLQQDMAEKKYNSDLMRQQSRDSINNIIASNYLGGTLGGNQDFNIEQVNNMVSQLPAEISSEIEGFYSTNPQLRYQSSEQKQRFFERLAMLNPSYKDLILQQLGA